METIKVGFVDHYELMDDFFVEMLSTRYNVVRDQDKPDYLFYSCFGMKHYTGKYDDAIKIAVLHENLRPNSPGFGDAKFTIGYDFSDLPHILRLPLYVVDYWNMHTRMGMHHYDDRPVPEAKTKFCGFIVGNENCEERNNFFHLLSQYKKVDSAGPVFNNLGYTLPRGATAPFEKFQFLKPYKFNMCYENASYPGYVTEKLFHALYMNTVPIYWGSSKAELDFNPKAFLSRHNYADDYLFLQAIKELDENDEQYFAMLSEPMFYKPLNQEDVMKPEYFLNWFENVVRKK